MRASTKRGAVHYYMVGGGRACARGNRFDGCVCVFIFICVCARVCIHTWMYVYVPTDTDAGTRIRSRIIISTYIYIYIAADKGIYVFGGKCRRVLLTGTNSRERMRILYPSATTSFFFNISPLRIQIFQFFPAPSPQIRFIFL